VAISGLAHAHKLGCGGPNFRNGVTLPDSASDQGWHGKSQAENKHDAMVTPNWKQFTAAQLRE